MLHSRSLVLAGIIAVAAGCGGSSPTGGGGGGGGGCSGTSGAPAVCDNFFSPTTSNITAGTTLTWTFKGSNTHNVTFTSGSLIGTQSANMSSGTFNQAFPTAGTFTYECSIHGFTGTVVVN